MLDRVWHYVRKWTWALGLDAWRVEAVDGVLEDDDKEWAGSEVQRRYHAIDMTYNCAQIESDDHSEADIEHLVVHEMCHSHTWRPHQALTLALRLLAKSEGIDPDTSRLWTWIEWALAEMEEEHTEAFTTALLRAVSVPHEPERNGENGETDEGEGSGQASVEKCRETGNLGPPWGF